MTQAKYRLAINGFSVLAETLDDMLNFDGQHDEVYFEVNTKVVDGNGVVKADLTLPSMTMGDVRGFSGRLQVGTASDLWGHKSGGIVTGDSYPSASPFLRSVDLTKKEQADPRRFPPYTIWEGTLTQGATDVTFVTPTVWEWDTGPGAAAGWVQWLKNTDAAFGTRAKEIFGGIWPVSKPFFDAVSLGIQTFATLPGLWGPGGRSMRRPIGLQRDPADPNGSIFNPTTFALTYDSAEFLVAHNLNGLGNGIMAVSYYDDPALQGAYVIYVQLEKVSGSPNFPDGTVVREISRPEVYVIYGNAKFWIPSPAELPFYGGWAAVRVVSDGALANAGVTDIPIDGTLLRERNNPVVWRIEGGVKRWVTNPTVLLKYGGWGMVRVVPDQATLIFPQGADLV